MKKNLILLLAYLAFGTPIFSQENETPIKNKHTVYLEIFGQGFSGSLNYDLLFNSDRKWRTSLTTGIIAIPRSLGFGDGTYLGIPVSYNWLYGKKRNLLELGIGLTTQLGEGYSFENGSIGTPKKSLSALYTYITPKLGYRFQPDKHGVFFRATLTPHLALVNTRFSARNGSLTTNHTFFQNFMNVGYGAFPWFGASIGYTFK
ncbi:hypothetical protein D3C71_411910 [compost metagenome]